MHISFSDSKNDLNIVEISFVSYYAFLRTRNVGFRIQRFMIEEDCVKWKLSVSSIFLRCIRPVRQVGLESVEQVSDKGGLVNDHITFEQFMKLLYANVSYRELTEINM